MILVSLTAVQDGISMHENQLDMMTLMALERRIIGEMGIKIKEVKQEMEQRQEIKVNEMSKADLTTVVRAPLIKYVNETKWETHFSDIDWVQVYRIMGQKTIPRKIREFQWKIINWAVYTENRLKHVASTDGLCCLCGTEVETVTHMLVDCETVREYWTAVLILITKNIPSVV